MGFFPCALLAQARFPEPAGDPANLDLALESRGWTEGWMGNGACAFFIHPDDNSTLPRDEIPIEIRP
jgi:hypothetical protein